MEFKYVLEIAIKSLMCGGVVSFAASSAMNLDNWVASLTIWVGFSLVYGGVAWFCSNNRNADKKQSDDDMKNQLSEMEKLFKEMLSSVNAISSRSIEMSEKLSELSVKIDTQTDRLVKSVSDVAANNADLIGKLSENAEAQGGAIRESLGGVNVKFEALGEKVDAQTDRLVKSVSDVAANHADLIGKLSENVETQGGAIRESFGGVNVKLEALGEKVDTQTDSLVKSVSDIAANNAELIGKLSENAEAQGGAIRESLGGVSGKLEALGDIKYAIDDVCIKLNDVADNIEDECNDTHSIKMSMTAIDKAVKDYQTAAENFSNELAEYNSNYKDNFANVSKEMNAVAKTLCDNYKMMKLIGDRYV